MKIIILELKPERIIYIVIYVSNFSTKYKKPIFHIITSTSFCFGHTYIFHEKFKYINCITTLLKTQYKFKKYYSLSINISNLFNQK